MDEEIRDLNQKEGSRVLDESQKGPANGRVLESYDATTLVGLRTVVKGAAIEHTDEGGEELIEVPKLRQLVASAAITRCLMPIRLRGWEMKAMRRIMKMTLAELARKLDGRTATETISRWENEAQPVGGYAEKVFRLLVCTELHEHAPGVEYDGSMIAYLDVMDPWRANTGYEVPYIELKLIHIKEASGSIIEGWDAKKAA